MSKAKASALGEAMTRLSELRAEYENANRGSGALAASMRDAAFYELLSLATAATERVAELEAR